MGLQLDRIEIPHDLVVFQATRLHRVLVFNPYVATFTTIHLSQFAAVREFVRQRHRNADVADGGVVDYEDAELDVALRHLIVNRVVYYGSHRPQLEDATPAVPASLYWETTHGCSLRCVYCYMGADTVFPDELSTSEARDLINQAAELGIRKIVFTGGEPLIRKDIYDLGRFAKASGLRADIITNATLITSEGIACRLRDTFDAVTTSLDGGVPEANDVHRGRGSFDAIVRGIKYLNAVGIKPTINSTISSANVAFVGDLVQFCRSQIAAFPPRISHVAALGRAAGPGPYDLQTYMRTFRTIREITGATKDHLQKQRDPRTLGPQRSCGMVTGEIYVDARGNVFPCKLVTAPEWRAGNVRDSKLAALLAAPPMVRARQLTVDRLPWCSTCVFRHLCGGGCRGIHMGCTGDAMSNDVQFCRVLRHRMVTSLWRRQGYDDALDDSEALVARFLTGKLVRYAADDEASLSLSNAGKRCVSQRL